MTSTISSGISYASQQAYDAAQYVRKNPTRLAITTLALVSAVATAYFGYQYNFSMNKVAEESLFQDVGFCPAFTNSTQTPANPVDQLVNNASGTILAIFGKMASDHMTDFSKEQGKKVLNFAMPLSSKTLNQTDTCPAKVVSKENVKSEVMNQTQKPSNLMCFARNFTNATIDYLTDSALKLLKIEDMPDHIREALVIKV